jgi:hypothetical protein
MRKRAVIKYFKALYQKCRGGTEENHAVYKKRRKSCKLVKGQGKIFTSRGGTEENYEFLQSIYVLYASG